MRAIALSALVALLSPGCDASYHLDCDGMCDLTARCSGDYDEVGRCLDWCERLDDLLREQTRRDLDACLDVGCEAYPGCVTQAWQSCDGDVGRIRDHACGIAAACGAMTLEECRQEVLDDEGDEVARLRCLDDGAVKDINRCVDQATCQTLPGTFQDCLEAVLDELNPQNP